MPPTVITMSYLVAGLCFILSLGGLSKQETARRGNVFGLVGMFIALGAAVFSADLTAYHVLAMAMLPAIVIGAVLAARVQMTSMPQLVAILHSFVGLAAVLVGFASYLHAPESAGGDAAAHAHDTIHLVEVFLGVAIGAITFTGSVLAFLKLQGTVSGAPLLLPGRHLVNLAMVIVTTGLGAWFLSVDVGAAGTTALIIATLITAVLGFHLVAAIGGADMPVVVSMLNSYSGWAAAAAGFMLKNDLLIITGALVGSSGFILSVIMCRGMNRSIVNVIFGGFGTSDTGGGGGGAAIEGTVQSIEVAETVALLRAAQRVVIVPGYGMAVAQAQHALAQVTRHLRDQKIDVKFAIHPVAGRLPGHMNVLLAEASIPYDIVLEMDEINDDLPATDVVLVIGANDIVNPSALDDPTSAIAGMPVLEVWNAETVVVMKRSMASGYAGIGNPLFVKPNTRMLFGDARTNVEAILGELTR